MAENTLPTLSIPRDVIEPIIQANVTAAVASALNINGGEIIRKLVDGVMNAKCDSEGRIRGDNYYDKHSWIDVTIASSIRATVKSILVAELNNHEATIRKHIQAELSKKNSPLIKQFAETMAKSAVAVTANEYRLNVILSCGPQ